VAAQHRPSQYTSEATFYEKIVYRIPKSDDAAYRQFYWVVYPDRELQSRAHSNLLLRGDSVEAAILPKVRFIEMASGEQGLAV